MQHHRPQTLEQLCAVLRETSARKQTIQLQGAGTKSAWGGASAGCDALVSTESLTKVLQYEPKDLTVSVEAGMRFADLLRLLEQNRQTLPLDPPYEADCTVGGVLAANSSGSRRRLYGTARDMVIGMTIVTASGDIARSGGLVVKNVAGLDLQKILIGSYGTLGVIGSVNFKVASLPEFTRTFVQSFRGAADASASLAKLLSGALLPSGIDILDPTAAERCGLAGYALVISAGGSARVLDRYVRDLDGAENYEGERERALLDAIREFTPSYLDSHSEGAMVRVVHRVSDIETILGAAGAAIVSRAGNGVSLLHYADALKAASAAAALTQAGTPAVVEATRAASKASLDLWPSPGNDLQPMLNLKRLLDPHQLLNPGRLYGRI